MPGLLDRVRETLRVRHYSRRTEQAYVAWIIRFIEFHGPRDPGEISKREVIYPRSGTEAGKVAGAR